MQVADGDQLVVVVVDRELELRVVSCMAMGLGRKGAIQEATERGEEESQRAPY